VRWVRVAVRTKSVYHVWRDLVRVRRAGAEPHGRGEQRPSPPSLPLLADSVAISVVFELKSAQALRGERAVAGSGRKGRTTSRGPCLASLSATELDDLPFDTLVSRDGGLLEDDLRSGAAMEAGGGVNGGFNDGFKSGSTRGGENWQRWNADGGVRTADWRDPEDDREDDGFTGCGFEVLTPWGATGDGEGGDDDDGELFFADDDAKRKEGDEVAAIARVLSKAGGSLASFAARAVGGGASSRRAPFEAQEGAGERGVAGAGNNEATADDEGCYAVLEAVRDLWPAPDGKGHGGKGGAVRDFLASPLPNGYRGLHAAVLLPRRSSGRGGGGDAESGGELPSEAPPAEAPPAEVTIEVQVRSAAMESAALFGMAAKWRRLAQATGRVQWGVWERP